MKTLNKYVLSTVVIVFLMIGIETFAQVGIGTTMPNNNSQVDITSTTKGFLPPRMTTVERNTLGATLLITLLPAEAGMLVFDTTLKVYYYWDGTVWVALAAAGGYVDLTTNQIIAGNKTFTGNLIPTGRIMVPMGEISYFSTTGSIITMASQSDGTTNMVAVNPATTLTMGAYEFDNGGANDGTLKYTGATTKMFHMAITVSGTPETGNNVFVFGVALNGTVITTGKVLGSSSGTQFSSLHIMLELKTNDKVQLQIGNTTASKNFTVKSLNFFAMGL
ncbi:MAG: hypothetical protein GZ086_06420 [Gelidibacter sp.]|nr:hypothetical protein [Gelidibacter sp.]